MVNATIWSLTLSKAEKKTLHVHCKWPLRVSIKMLARQASLDLKYSHHKQRLHERCFIWNRIVFDAVTPSVYTTPIETVAETGSIWKRCQKLSVFKTIRIYLTCKRRNRIDLSTVTIIVRNLHSSIQNGESCTKFSARMCHHITSYLLFFPEAIQNITIFNISSGTIPNQHPKPFYWLRIH